MKSADLRILIVIDAIEQRNGVGTYFYDLVKHLRQRVARVELVAPRLDVPHPCQGVSIPMPGDPTQRLFFPKLRELAQLVLEMKPHVIVVPGPGIFSLAALWLGLRTGTPVCVTHQTDYNQLANLYWKGTTARIMSGLLRWVTTLMFRRSSSVATISEHMIEQARACGVRFPSLVATPLSPDFVESPLAASGAEVNKVLFVGRLAAEKNLESFLNLARTFPQLQFSIAGDGPERALVERAVSELPNLNFHGWCSREQVRALVDEHDLLVLPSKVEAFGTAALEAMARQRLVMTTRACGINQWPGLDQALVIQRGEECLTQTLTRLLQTSPAQREDIALRARQAALGVNEAAMEQWLSVLQLTANKHHTLPEPGLSPAYSLLRRLAS